MSAVVSTDRNCIELEALVIKHFLVRSVIGLSTRDAVLSHVSGSLAGNNISARNDLNVGHIFVRIHMSVCDPSASDDTDTKLSARVNNCIVGLYIIIKSRIHFFCHFLILHYIK